jgi:hypothetical protein
MFCPKCGTQNGGEASFCRGCGEDLALVAQAVNRSPSLVVAHKLEEALKRNPTVQLAWLKDRRRRAAGEILTGAVTLFVLVWFVLLGKGNPEFAYGVIAAISCYLLALGVWDFWSAPRTSEAASHEKTTNALGDASARGELSAADTSEMPPATSVTERTTALLDRDKPARRP